MIDYNALRALARRKRDAAYLHAKNEYEATLREIYSLERKLEYDRGPNNRKLRHKVDAVVPIGKDFTVDDLFESIQALDPKSASWTRDSVGRYVTKLYKNGVIQRVRNQSRGNPAVYRRADHPEKMPEKRTLVMLLDDVMTKPMTVQEITVAVLAAGFVTVVSPVNLSHRIAHILRHGPFISEGERWRKG